MIDLLRALETAPGPRGSAIEQALYAAWLAANPDDTGQAFAARFNLGVAAAAAGDRIAAAQAYHAALASRPEFYPAAVNLGLLQEADGQPETALATWERALQPDAARTALLNQRARLLEQIGRLDEAEGALRASLATHPAQPDAVQHFVHLRQSLCHWPVLDGTAVGLSAAELRADCGPLAALALTDDVAEQTAITARWIARRLPAAPARLSPTGGYRHDRIRLGYLSSDFGNHAMGFLIAELIERHDRSCFAVHGYSLGREDGSDIRARIRDAFDRFVPLAGLSDPDAAHAIADDEIDILIDLNGLTLGARPQILRWRPAPVQATYLGFIGPMPLPELDYLLCDDTVVPPDLAPLYRPQPLAIGSSFQANDNQRAIGPPTSRTDNALPEDGFVFCCFARHYKVTPEMFAIWMAILARVPGSVLWLAADNAWSRQNLVAAAERQGIAPRRLIFAERTDPARYMRRLELADLFLDTFPYNAGTVASDAIRMGLPMVTLAGRSFASRMAASLLHAIGATAGVTGTPEAYGEAAVTLATSRDAYASHRARFGAAAWHATLGDMARFTAQLENVLRARVLVP